MDQSTMVSVVCTVVTIGAVVYVRRTYRRISEKLRLIRAEKAEHLAVMQEGVNLAVAVIEEQLREEGRIGDGEPLKITIKEERESRDNGWGERVKP